MQRTFMNWLLVLLVLPALLAACNRTPENREEDVIAVRKVMEARKHAIENRDIDAYKALFHPEYNDGRHSPADLFADLESAFKRYDKITFTYQRAPVELKMNTARVIQRIIFHVEPGGKDIHDHEQLLMRKSDGVWRISGGVKLGLL